MERSMGRSLPVYFTEESPEVATNWAVSKQIFTICENVFKFSDMSFCGFYSRTFSFSLACNDLKSIQALPQKA